MPDLASEVISEVRRLGDVIERLTRELQQERRERAVDLGALRVTAERLVDSLPRAVCAGAQ